MTALVTRDAVLPIVSVLADLRGGTVAQLVSGLPPRVTYSDRIAGFPTEDSKTVIAWLLAGDAAAQLARIAACFGDLAGTPVRIDVTDGVRIYFADGDIIHLRPSGNAPEFRCYTEAADGARAQELNVAAFALLRERILPAAQKG